MPTLRSCSPPDERGSALLEVLALGSAVVVVVAAVAMSTASVVSTGEAARMAARNGAVWGARYGDESLARSTALAQAPAASIVTARRHGDVIEVTVRTNTRLFPLDARRSSVRMEGRAAMPIAPFRSNRE